MNDMEHCIVTLFDIVGIKQALENEKQDAIQIMRRVHQDVYGQVSTVMNHNDHAYCWNDSVLLLAGTDRVISNAQEVMAEVVALKKRLDAIQSCYVISVKGLSIPGPLQWSGSVIDGSLEGQAKFVYIKASSMAFSNCFEIEKALKKLQMQYYIDSRIAQKLKTTANGAAHNVAMLPDRVIRPVMVYNEHLW